MPKYVIACAALLAAACGGDGDAASDEGVPDAAPHPERHIRLWVAPSSGLPGDTLAEGCGRWSAAGVGCEVITAREESDVQVFAETGACDPDGDGSYVLAYAGCCGPIVFREDCFRSENGAYDHEALRIVMAHETGHEFGLWWHILRECSGDPPTHPDGTDICGKAIMNPFYDPSVAAPNAVDLRAFDVRDTSASVADDHNHHAPDGGASPSFTCVYRTLPERGR